MGIRSSISKLFSRNTTNLARAGRASYATTRQRIDSFFGYLRPKEAGGWKYGDITAKQLKSRHVGYILSILIENSDVLSLSVNVHKQKIVQGYDLVSPQKDDNAIQVISDFYKNMSSEFGVDLQSLLLDFAYSLFVEGALCAELVFSPDGSEPKEICLISPLTLKFPDKKDPSYGKYNQIAQEQSSGKDKVLYDKYNPDEAEIDPDCFVYTPINVLEHNPFGSSDLTPAIFSTLAIKEFLDLLTKYSKVQIFQRGVVSTDLGDYINSDKYEDTDAIASSADEAVENIKSTFDDADETQIIFSNYKVEFTPIGNQTRANMDGAQIVMRVLERSQGRGSKLPRVIYNPDRDGNSLGNAESQTEWQIFQDRLTAYRKVINEAFTKFHRTILRHYGIMSDVEMELDDTDYEGMLLFAEVVGKTMDTITQGITEARVITRQEGRSLLLKLGSLFKDIPPELPEELLEDNNQIEQGEDDEPQVEE